MGSRNSSLSFKTLFRIFTVLGFILIGTLQSEGNKTKITLTADDDESWPWKGKLQPQGENEQVKNSGKGKSTLVHPPVNLYYVSKRKVPNGPDPIHNRRAGNSRRRPGQA